MGAAVHEPPPTSEITRVTATKIPAQIKPSRTPFDHHSLCAAKPELTRTSDAKIAINPTS